MLEYLYAFRHVPLWWWGVGFSVIFGNILIVHPKSWNWLAIQFGKDRPEKRFTRSFREYAGSNNGWASN
jgi:hypothetical protein